MLNMNDLLKVLKSYNISSTKYGPTLLEINEKKGICLEIKDANYGYLTRGFIFEEIKNAEEFLQKYFWFKNNKKIYNIKLTLNEYNTKTTNLKYTYNDRELTLNDMLNLKDTITNEEEQKIIDKDKNIYLSNIKDITNYLINLKSTKTKNKENKNNLKIKENNLKYELLVSLALYYGKNKEFAKKAVSLESITTNNDKDILETNAKNIVTKDITEIKNYLSSLIEITKTEELDENNLINIYSNSIYNYNIEILNKQIEFVKNKIASEKKFNLKGSKIHNIDEELKSFLKSSVIPTKIEVFLEKSKKEIINKYQKINDIKNASLIITGKELSNKSSYQPATPSHKNLSLEDAFKYLPPKSQKCLILYNSIYKNICNYIIDNNYPSLETIKNAFDFSYYYTELEEIIYHENNNHYLINYFTDINFKTINTYITSIIEICKTIDNTILKTPNKLKVFSLNNNNTYKYLSLTPFATTNKIIYTIDIPADKFIIYVPERLEINDETKEISTIKNESIYIRGNIVDTNETFTLNKYNKIDENYQNSDIIVTTDLILINQIVFHIATIEGEKLHE